MVAVGVFVLVVGYLLSSGSVNKLGSVNRSNEYRATTTLAAWANIPHMITSDSSAVLGSVVIGTTHASIVEIWNATSSTDIASTTIAVIAASPVIGSTMTFDVAAPRGLMVNTVTGFTGRYTITYR